MKKIIALLLALAMVVSICACGGQGGTDTTQGGSEGGEVTTAAAGGEVEETSAESVEEQQSGLAATLEANGLINYADFGKADVIDPSRKTTADGGKYKSITLGAQNEIKSWTAWQSGRGRSELVIGAVWEPLAYNTDGFEIENCLAKEWHWKDESNKTDCIVEIYDYIKDQDGNEIKASDVKFSLEQAMGAGIAGDYNKVDHIDVVDDYTVDIVFKEPNDSIIILSTILFTAIASEKATAEHDFVSDPCGTGPYKLESQVVGANYHLVRNENYWQKPELCCLTASGQGNVDEINVEVISENNTRYMAFENGEIFSVQVDSLNVPDFLEGGKHFGEYTVTYELNGGRYGIEFNMSGKDKSGVMSDENLRKAICYAIDGEGVVAAVGEYGYYQVHGEAGVSCNGYQNEWDKLENYYSVYDVDLAKDYLSKSKYNGETLVFLVQSGQTAMETAAQIIQQELLMIGINVDIRILDMAVMTDAMGAFEWDIAAFMWAGDDIGQQWSRQLDVTGQESGLTENGLNDPEFQQMIADVQLDSKRSDELINKIQQYMVDNCIMYSLFGQVNYMAYNKDLARMSFSSGHKQTDWGGADYYLD